MAIDPQRQPAFITRLPREIRDLIYLELWRASGLRQHILRHYRFQNKHLEEAHFCRWPCRTEFEVKDGLQEDIDALRRQLGLSLPGPSESDKVITDVRCYRRLRSPWLNHWACGERLEEESGFEIVTSAPSTSVIHPPPCPRRTPADPSSYIPMLQSCKLISAESKKSIYESTTFIFTDVMTFQLFAGYCKTPNCAVENRFLNIGFPKPVLLEHVRLLELSLTPNFELVLPCSASSFPGETIKEENLHNAYDFHWLRLNRFRNLRSLNIWMAARGHDMFPLSAEDPDPVFVPITRLDTEHLMRSLANLAGSFKVTLSTPLHEEITPEDGYVEGIAPPNVRLWKRGTGDWYHPDMLPGGPTSPLYGRVSMGSRRKLKVGSGGSS
ncbi:hypothetical protein V8F06_011623 [Rhypophila decipiens]